MNSPKSNQISFEDYQEMKEFCTRGQILQHINDLERQMSTYGHDDEIERIIKMLKS